MDKGGFWDAGNILSWYLYLYLNIYGKFQQTTSLSYLKIHVLCSIYGVPQKFFKENYSEI